jgi:hypothetical protein
MIKMLAPLESGGFAHSGKAYLPDRDGIIELPESAVDVARSHRFTVLGEATTPADKKAR